MENMTASLEVIELAAQCPLSGVKRTCLFALHMSAYDPKRTYFESMSGKRMIGAPSSIIMAGPVGNIGFAQRPRRAIWSRVSIQKLCALGTLGFLMPNMNERSP